MLLLRSYIHANKFNVSNFCPLHRFFFTQVDKESNKHGGQLVAEVLKAHGVSNLFTLIGGHISPIVVAAEKCGIRIIDTRHEATAVFAADAYARLSGGVGVAAVTAGPGLTNTITAVKNAQMAETPLLLIGGAAATLLKGRGALQDIDQMSLFTSLCKYKKSVRCVRQIVPVLREAFQSAQSGTPGPVFVELPLDVLYPYKLVKQEMKLKDNPKGFTQKIIDTYLRSYLHYQFASAFTPKDVSPLPLNIPRASNNEVERCQDLLLEAKRPIILLGSQAMIPASLTDELKTAVELLNIPCFLGGMARGLLGSQSPLHIRQERKEALKDADLVILAGAVCDFRLSYGRVLNPKSKIICINRDKTQLQKNAGVFWRPTISIQGGVSDFFIRLANCLTPTRFDLNWLPLLRERDTAKESENRDKASVNDLSNGESQKPLNPLHLLYELEESLSKDTILIVDGGDFVASASYIVRARGPLMWLDPGAFGTLGVGAGFAIGAKLHNPNADVVILYGDGSCGYSIVEFDTFVRHSLAVVALVGNDACWTQIAREQVPLFQSEAACNLKFSDYHKVAEALGAEGMLLTNEQKDKLQEKFKEALEWSKNGRSVLINAIIGKTDFRSGSISI